MCGGGPGSWLELKFCPLSKIRGVEKIDILRPRCTLCFLHQQTLWSIRIQSVISEINQKKFWFYLKVRLNELSWNFFIIVQKVVLNNGNNLFSVGCLVYFISIDWVFVKWPNLTRHVCITVRNFAKKVTSKWSEKLVE